MPDRSAADGGKSDWDRPPPVETAEGQQALAASIERDFRALLDGLEAYQSMVGSSSASHVEKVKGAIERGIELSLCLQRAVNRDD